MQALWNSSLGVLARGAAALGGAMWGLRKLSQYVNSAALQHDVSVVRGALLQPYAPHLAAAEAKDAAWQRYNAANDSGNGAVPPPEAFSEAETQMLQSRDVFDTMLARIRMDDHSHWFHVLAALAAFTPLDASSSSVEGGDAPAAAAAAAGGIYQEFVGVVAAVYNLLLEYDADQARAVAQGGTWTMAEVQAVCDRVATVKASVAAVVEAIRVVRPIFCADEALQEAVVDAGIFADLVEQNALQLANEAGGGLL